MIGPLRAVFFDAGNTLVQMNYAAIAEELGRLGTRVAPADVQRAEWRARVRLDDELFGRTGPASTETRSSADRYVRHLLEELGVRDEATIARATEFRHAYNPPIGIFNVVDPQAREALELVRRAGLRAGVISNSNGSVRASLQALGLAPYLDFVLDSGEVGFEKPDPRIFELALARAGIAAAEAVHVGDLYSIDVRGARAGGLHAVLLDPGGHWGERDCPRVPDLLSAIRLVTERR
jgi:HAD superfamily hydrolase (TIGR01549 family)